MENIIIIVSLVLFLYFLIVGQYISSLMFSIGMIGIFLIGGMDLLSGFLQNEPFARTASYALTTIPLYILMAQFIMQAGIVKDLYSLMYTLSRGRPGPLGVMTILLGGLLGGVSGSGTATSAALGQIAVPELQKRGYPDHLAGTIAAAAGSLSAIIPPSVILILYGVVAQISIGELFTAALIPGILLMLVFSVLVIIYLRFNSKELKAASQEYVSDNVPISRYFIVTILGGAMGISIFGGIYLGVFSPTEAGAVGAFIALIMATILGKINLNFFKTSMVETTKITVMAMFIVVGASLFGKFISLSLVPRKIIDLLGPIMDSPVLVIIIIMVFYFFLFMLIESVAVILMTVPIIMPIVTAIDADPVWFGIMLTIVCTVGMLTPPVGISVYAVGGVTGIPIERLFKTSTVFAVVATIVVIGLLIVFPEIVTWLPSQMR
ncbi:TRAP transporter large permease [Planomicrobium sp. YIM 101495]|uniref:TRAP transporter large permease n=1 Tax=Planomicrobium sp. YIM 101495 TaxID=2665160 RepID=UPI0012BA358D|nr:TRAP transporter large permease [Planomicrobium sp. YIM 101495]MTD30984.1 TRAP transporter large permease subunit [Planomicrobium sp. YIM 101495]